MSDNGLMVQIRGLSKRFKEVQALDGVDLDVGRGRIIGLLAAVFQMEILIKPLAFCLPGHGRMVRKFIFLVAAVTNSLGALLFLFYPGLSLTRLPLVYGIIIGGIMSRTEGPTMYSLQTTIILCVAAWALFALVLHHVATKRCLVR